MIEEILKKLGMTENEARVYLTLLKLGPSASGKIIQKTEFQSSVVYHLIHKLMEKGFVSFSTENKKKVFSAADPVNLQKLVDERQFELTKLKEELNEEIKELKKIKTNEETNITVFRGAKGIQTLFNDLLNNAKEFYNYSTTNTFAKVMPKYREYFREMRIAKKIKQKAIIADDLKKPNRAYQEKRYIPKDYASPVGFEVYNNKVIIFVWDAEPPLAIVLEGNKVSKAFKNIFDTMWKTARP